MSHRNLLLVIAFFLFSSCSANTAPSNANKPTPQPHEVGSYNCQGRVHATSSGTVAPSSTPRSLYFGNNRGNFYAVNAQTGELRWCLDLNNPKTATTPSTLIIGTPTVVDGVVYVCASDGGEAGYLYTFNASDGSLRWVHLMGDYVGAALLNNVAYVSSGGPSLDAFNMSSGTVLWHYKFTHLVSISNPTLTTGGMLYINADGAYALRSENGRVLWHKPLGADQSVYFLPPVVVDGVDYVVRTDGHGNSMLYALNASNGAEYWQSTNLPQLSPLTVA